MSNPTHPQPEPGEPDPLAFTPVPIAGTRHNGWTHRRQTDFIAALAVTGTVSRACRAVGMSRQSAYALRERSGAESFTAAWDIALQMGYDHAFGIVMERAMHGITRPRYYKGRQIGTITRPDTRLLMAALADGPPPPPRRKADTNDKPDTGDKVDRIAPVQRNYVNLQEYLASLGDSPLEPLRTPAHRAPHLPGGQS